MSDPRTYIPDWVERWPSDREDDDREQPYDDTDDRVDEELMERNDG